MTAKSNAAPRARSADRRIEFARFVAAGGAAAAVNVASGYLFALFMPYRVAIVPAYFCGMVTAYLLNKYLVFAPSSLRARAEFARFVVVNMIALIQVWVVTVGLAQWLFPAVGFTFHAPTIAHVVGVTVPVFTSYFGHKHFSFSRARGE